MSTLASGERAVTLLADDSVGSLSLACLLRTLAGVNVRTAAADRLAAGAPPDGPVGPTILVSADGPWDVIVGRVRALSADRRVLVVGPVDLVADALRAGATGFATLRTVGDEFVDLVDWWLGGRLALSQDASAHLVSNGGPLRLRQDDLSARQQRVLAGLGRGQSVSTVARELGVSRQAVSQTVERLRPPTSSRRRARWGFSTRRLRPDRGHSARPRPGEGPGRSHLRPAHDSVADARSVARPDRQGAAIVALRSGRARLMRE